METRPLKTDITLPRRFNPTFHSVSEFDMKQQLGEGATSTVYLAIHKRTGKKYAIKQIIINEISPKDYENIEKELDLHRELKNPYIVEMFDFFKENGIVNIVMEYVCNGNVFKFLNSYNPLSDYHIGRIWAQTALGIEYLHDKGILMRDIKPENLVLDEDYNLKLCDFGWATRLSDTEYKKLKGGTFVYMSPETLKGEEQDKASDIWSLGVLLFELLHNREPYTGADSCEEQLYFLNVQRVVYKKNVTLALSDLISEMLNKDWRLRPSIKDILKRPFTKPHLEEIRINKRMKLPEIDMSDKKKYQFDPNFKPYVISNGDALPLPPGAKVTTKKNGIVTTKVIETQDEIADTNQESNGTGNGEQIKTLKKLIDNNIAVSQKEHENNNQSKFERMKINQTSAEAVEYNPNNQQMNNNVNRVDNYPVSFNSKSIPDETLANGLLSKAEFGQLKSVNNFANQIQNDNQVASNYKTPTVQSNYKTAIDLTREAPSYTSRQNIKSSNNMTFQSRTGRVETSSSQAGPVPMMNKHVSVSNNKIKEITENKITPSSNNFTRVVQPNTVTIASTSQTSNVRKIHHQKNKSYDPRSYYDQTNNPINEYALQSNQTSTTHTNGNNGINPTVQRKIQVSTNEIRTVQNTPQSSQMISHNRSKSRNRVIKLADYTNRANINVTSNTNGLNRGMTKNRSYNDLKAYHARLDEIKRETNNNSYKNKQKQQVPRLNYTQSGNSTTRVVNKTGMNSNWSSNNTKSHGLKKNASVRKIQLNNYYRNY